MITEKFNEILGEYLLDSKFVYDKETDLFLCLNYQIAIKLTYGIDEDGLDADFAGNISSVVFIVKSEGEYMVTDAVDTNDKFELMMSFAQAIGMSDKGKFELTDVTQFICHGK